MTMVPDQETTARIGRRALLLGMAGAALAPALARAQDAADAEDEEGDGEKVTIAEVPSFGARRPGPVVSRANPRRDRRPKTYLPVQLTIPDAAVDAPVEVGVVTPEGVMMDPSGPWVATWYEVLGAPGATSNVVISGHLDYWDTGPAVFWNVPALPAGSMFYLTMADGTVFQYALDWARLYNVRAELTPEVIQTEVVGPTGQESITLITCGGEFDYAAGEYLYRWVIRAHKV